MNRIVAIHTIAILGLMFISGLVFSFLVILNPDNGVFLGVLLGAFLGFGAGLIGRILTEDGETKWASKRAKRITYIVLTIFVIMLAIDIKAIYSTNQTVDNIKSQATTEQQYVDAAISGCTESGQKASLCQCFYGDLMEEYGIDEVYAVDDPSSDTPSPHAEEILRSCNAKNS